MALRRRRLPGIKAAEEISARQGQQQAEACAACSLPAGEGKSIPEELRPEKTGQLLPEAGAKDDFAQEEKNRQVKKEKQEKVDRVLLASLCAPLFPRAWAYAAQLQPFTLLPPSPFISIPSRFFSLLNRLFNRPATCPGWPRRSPAQVQQVFNGCRESEGRRRPHRNGPGT